MSPGRAGARCTVCSVASELKNSEPNIVLMVSGLMLVRNSPCYTSLNLSVLTTATVIILSVLHTAVEVMSSPSGAGSFIIIASRGGDTLSV